MRKLKTFLLTALMSVTLCLCFIFTGCSGKIEGTYKFKSISRRKDGTVETYEVGDVLDNGRTITENYITITLYEDGWATVTTLMEGSETATVTWEKQEDGKIAITFENNTQVFDCDGTTLTFTDDVGMIVLTK